MRKYLFSLLSVIPLSLVLSCTPYVSKEVPFRLPTAYGNVQVVEGANVAAEAFADGAKAKDVFGFDIREAGLLPVQIVIENGGLKELQIVPGQTFLVDRDGGMWNLLDRDTAYERLKKSSEFARVAKQAGRGAGYGALGGAAVGAAIGILTGQNVGESVLKGAAVGGAGGTVVGGAQELGSPEGTRQIFNDLGEKEFENKPVSPGFLGRGFLFFPGEAPSAGKLRMQVKEVGSGKTHLIMFLLD